MDEWLTPSGRASALAELSPERQAWFALACGEHLLPAEPAETRADLRITLDAGWGAIRSGDTSPVSVIRETFIEREDLDADAVASVAFALDAVLGIPDSAFWAVGRVTDAAFSAVPYPQDAYAFRPWSEDASHEIVRSECQWLANAMACVKRARDTSDVIEWLQ
jgi:hypothetical protein